MCKVIKFPKVYKENQEKEINYLNLTDEEMYNMYKEYYSNPENYEPDEYYVLGTDYVLDKNGSPKLI